MLPKHSQNKIFLTRSSEDQNFMVTRLEDLFKPSTLIHDNLIKPQPQSHSLL